MHVLVAPDSLIHAHEKLPCLQGTTDDDSDPSTPCVSCPAGSYTPELAFGLCANFPCPSGTTDHDSKSYTNCMICRNGTYTSDGALVEFVDSLWESIVSSMCLFLIHFL